MACDVEVEGIEPIGGSLRLCQEALLLILHAHHLVLDVDVTSSLIQLSDAS
jgi:hypothetical protein